MPDPDLLIKKRKEERLFPPGPDPEIRTCICGGSIYSLGRDYDGEPIYGNRCGSCPTPNLTPKKIEAINLNREKEHREYLDKRMCVYCHAKKPIPNGRWCADCCIRINTERMGTDEHDEVRVKIINYAKQFQEVSK